jgi:hypothetical protein
LTTGFWNDVLRPAHSAPCRELQIARHHAGAQKQEESGEPQNEFNGEHHEIRDSGSCAGRNSVSGRLSQEDSSAATSAAARAYRADGLAFGESEYDQPGTGDYFDVADDQRDRREH